MAVLQNVARLKARTVPPNVTDEEEALPGGSPRAVEVETVSAIVAGPTAQYAVSVLMGAWVADANVNGGWRWARSSKSDAALKVEMLNQARAQAAAVVADPLEGSDIGAM